MEEQQKIVLRDKDIREPLFDFLEETFGKIRIIEEKRMGRSRADIVMVLPAAIAGIEIKSDADSYTRLSRQVRDYNRFFDYNYVVVGSSHARHVSKHVPEWWGIISVELIDGLMDFYVIRKAAPNPKADLKKKLSFLWRPELAHIQALNGLPKYRDKSKVFVVEKIAGKVPEEILAQQISEELFERDYNTIAETIREFKKKPR